MLSTTVFFVCCIAACIAGFVDSIAGGGGLIVLPALLLCGIPPHLAMGTSKFATSMGTALALFNFARNNLVLWRVASVGVAFALLGAYGGSRMALMLDSAVMGKVLVALLPVGMAMTLVPKKEQPGALDMPDSGWRFWFGVPMTSVLVGMYDGFFGPGAGSFYILAFHWVLRMGLIEASATSKVFNLASNVGSLIAFLISGQVLFALALPMAAASMAGNWMGSRLAIRVGSSVVRKCLVVSLSLLLATLVWRYFIAA